ncbi:hypothetical protein K8374_06605 [Pseudomonas sp. p1(2021b)]|uniref:hypothetical protein n=1 Tax=Pseudomonas sp. p1(2021b) TaxID=2874628 RepID=UPI001CCFDA7B|nr:hypothetical protein [Pseudomonas sp. p1(2021b)]UBM26640.1 hypothetical protein K8374_06605 [Pseudomonas sp. p1(2021b)]
MSGNSLERVLETMKEINVTLGWGALVVYSRGCLNALIERHYVERLGQWNCLPRFDATIEREDGGLTHAQAIEFGVPTLSFASATTGDNRVQVSLPILSGAYRHESLRADDKLHYFLINEAMGFTLDVDVALDVAVIAGHHVLRLDLRNALDARCNLGLGAVYDERLAFELLRWLGNLEVFQSQFALVEIDSQGEDGWTPTEVRLYTQAAPAAQASGHGDGALLMFLKVKGRGREGLAPTPSFPYLLPDDGSERCPVTVVLDRSLDHLPGDVLGKLSYQPMPYAFAERTRHEPFDTAVFGSLVPQGLILTVAKPRHTLQVGTSHRFVLHDQHGTPVEASYWSVGGLGGLGGQPGEYGEIDHKTGLYRAMSLEQLKREDPVIVVNAKLYRDDKVYSASLRVRIAIDLFVLQPEVAIVAPTRSIDLQLAGPGPGYRWTLLDEPHGRLVQHNSKQATFVPDAVVSRKGLAVQQIRVDNYPPRRFSIVMSNGPQLLSIQSEAFRKLGYRESLHLQEQDPSFMPEAKRRWSLFGIGELSEDGRFTAPPNGTPGFSVVTCEIEHQGVVLATGYNVLQIGRP